MIRKIPNPVQIGEKFGKLTVLAKTSRRRHRNIYYSCKCECGNYVDIVGISLRTKVTNSCGCVRIARQQKPPGFATWNRHFNSYAAGAKNRNLEFKLSFEQFKEIASSNCNYCGESPVAYNHYKSEKKENISIESIQRATIFTNGIDRIDNNKGYTLDNAKACCTICNKMKLNYTNEFFISHISKIAKFKADK